MFVGSAHSSGREGEIINNSERHEQMTLEEIPTDNERNSNW